MPTDETIAIEDLATDALYQNTKNQLKGQLIAQTNEQLSRSVQELYNTQASMKQALYDKFDPHTLSTKKIIATAIFILWCRQPCAEEIEETRQQ